MPNSDKTTDDLLREYVISSSATLKHIADGQSSLSTQFAQLDKKLDLHTLEDNNRHAQVMTLGDSLKSRIDALEEDAEVTGQTQIDKLQKELDERKKKEAEAAERSSKERGKMIREIGSHVATALIMIVLTFVASHLLWHT